MTKREYKYHRLKKMFSRGISFMMTDNHLFDDMKYFFDSFYRLEEELREQTIVFEYLTPEDIPIKERAGCITTHTIPFNEEMWSVSDNLARGSNEGLVAFLNRLYDEGHCMYLYPDMRDRHPVTREKLDKE